MNATRTFALFLGLLLLASPVRPLSGGEPDRVQLMHDQTSMRAEIRVESPAGKLSLGDVFRGVARMNGYDDTELRDVIPGANVSLNNRAVRWSMDAFNWMMRPCVQCSVNDAAETFLVTVERDSARNWINRRKAQLRTAWSSLDFRQQPPEYGFQFIDPVEQHPHQDFVILVHGLNSRPADLRSLVPLVREAGHQPVHFCYPNDQPIDKSADLLAEELAQLRVRFPGKKVRLLTHSMGGLVARGVLELGKLDPGNVQQLIMVAPPNQGSALASVAVFMDCYEFCTSAEYRRPGVLVESVSDGLGEAAADLKPHSVFLDKLNNKPRNPNVRYTVLLGTTAPMDLEEMAHLRSMVRDYSDGNCYFRFASSKLNRSLGALDEVVDGRGDGAVSLQRGRLQGVSDIVTLPFSHAGVLNPTLRSSKRAHAVISARLQETL